MTSINAYGVISESITNIIQLKFDKTIKQNTNKSEFYFI